MFAHSSFSYTLPTILTQLGYKAETAQLMTVPLYVHYMLLNVPTLHCLTPGTALPAW